MSTASSSIRTAVPTVAAGGTQRRAAMLMLVTVAATTLSALTMRPAAGQVPSDAVLDIRMPLEVTVGDMDRTGQLQIFNPGAEFTSVDRIRFAPACALQAGDPENPCATPEPGVIVLDPVATGSAGSACSGTVFAVEGPDAGGVYTFTPATPVTLVGGSGPTSSCTINFTFDVVGGPAQDTAPGIDHAQTVATVGAVLNRSQPTESSGATGAMLTVIRATPSVATQASPSVPLGNPVSDSATVTGVPNVPPPTGIVEFFLYGPNDPTCVQEEASQLTVPLVNGTAQSPQVLVRQTGLYRWVAVYQGDENYAGRTNACIDPAEEVVVTQGTPTLTTQASPPVPVGGVIFDTATVTGVPGAVTPTGSVSFRVYEGVDCAGPDVGVPEPVPLVNGVAQSQPFTATRAGPYRFVALYSGDTNYAGALSACDDPAEEVIVTQATPTITTQASPSVPVGGSIYDTATVTGVPGGPQPTGTVSFLAYGPDATECIGLAFGTPPVAPLVNGVAQSDPIPVSQPGTYRFVASYSGDANYTSEVTACDDPAEQVVVTAAVPTIAVDKTVSPTSLPEPGGAFTFGVVVTNTSDEAMTITSLTDDRYGDLATRPGSTCGVLIGATLAPGDSSAPCTFTGTFTGNAEAFETDVVTATAKAGDGTVASATDEATVFITDVLPSATLDKTATPASLPAPGGTFTFAVVVTNTSAEPVSLTQLVDDVYGNLNGRGSCAVGATLIPGATYTCSFPGTFTGAAGASQTDVVTATVADDEGNNATASDSATVTIGPAPPTTTTSTTSTSTSTSTTSSSSTTTTTPATTTSSLATTTTIRPPTTTSSSSTTTSTTSTSTTSSSIPTLPTTTVPDDTTPEPTVPDDTTPEPTVPEDQTTTTVPEPTTSTSTPPPTTTTTIPTTTTTTPPAGTTTTTPAPPTTVVATEPVVTTAPAVVAEATVVPVATTAPVLPDVAPSTTAPETTSTSAAPSTTSAPTTSTPTTGPVPPTPSTPPTTAPPATASLDAVSPIGQRSGPPGVGLEVRGGGYADCGTVYFFINGDRVGSAKPDAGGAVTARRLSVPGGTPPGTHVVTSSCSPSGVRPRASATFVVTEADLHRSEFTTSLAHPDQISTELTELATSAAVALGIMVLFAFPCELFNSTVEENYDEMGSWFHRPPRDVEAVSALRRNGSFFLLTVVAAITVGFLSPDFGLSMTSLVMVVGFTVALLVMSVGFSLPGDIAIHRRTGEWGKLNFLPGTLVTAAVLVALTRMMHFQPGYFYGALAGLAFRSALSKEAVGRITAANWFFAVLVSVGAWFARMPVSEAAAHPEANIWWIGVEACLGLVFLWGIESLVVAMLPMRFLDGRKVIDWNRAVWFLLMFLGVFATVHVLFAPSSGYISHTTGEVTIGVMVLFLIFGAISVGLWAYFRFRPERESLRSASSVE